MHIAVVLQDRCQFKKCNYECRLYCPPVRMGIDTVVITEKGYPKIIEELCEGCGICVHKCPFEAVKIVGLPEELKEELVHQYGENGFRLYRLPQIKQGKVVGILGPNGVGKTTSLNILSGNLIPNLGNYEKKPSWDDVIDYFSGNVMADYFSKLRDGEIKTALKPQYVDKIPRVFKGKVKELLKNVNEDISEVASLLKIENILDRDVDKLSGGELQSVAIAATMLKDADVYFFDEPSSYLDIDQRLEIARIIKDLAEKKIVFVVEHDLAVMDFIADVVHILYGSEGAYGVVSQIRATRNAINSFLEGYLREENIRFRPWKIEFTEHPPKRSLELPTLIKWPYIEKKYENFKLEVEPGEIKIGEVVGVVGPNATGKTTFVKILAGVIKADRGEINEEVKVSYKPQYIKPQYDGTVEELLMFTFKDRMSNSFFLSEVINPLGIKHMYNKDVNALSGGEMQRLAIAICLGLEADLYLLDEPSAYLDSNQRMIAAKVIRRVMENTGKSALVVDHDVYFIDIVSDDVMVFGGEPARHGIGKGPYPMREGMNLFLKNVGITFRRDGETKRPRINKPGSYTDREQKEKGEYYYA
ncbi:ribosome biogenesis/translation initiation ATPase RLI [Candidatus Aciduliprofundum boonei]|uniref:ABC transporter related protein n=1 Tax=Aciduliprofundum boonei (strain DSM 19572 / T469) TaxID=439481 RepID=B5IAE7_ACIB4|nr:ribosome biogenesis/translation initiation ATPase RLI [Candidatus Aciduliprofundum boonei]ADD08210.1 ABC transporter related protein [Aciduliprofundum boonei T469]EDY36983.1 ABC transporter, ATP-binding protein [Aciduliprofundum boonei T469]HII55762.1 ribosome biogenesis/translation initiation ATPase RLI [Candidatus Aciduliprofundum boonei]